MSRIAETVAMGRARHRLNSTIRGIGHLLPPRTRSPTTVKSVAESPPAGSRTLLIDLAAAGLAPTLEELLAAQYVEHDRSRWR
jgi:hypothetical protein